MSDAPSFQLNGVNKKLRGRITLDELVQSVVASPNGCAVARNGEVVPRSDWMNVVVQRNDVIELLTVAQGG